MNTPAPRISVIVPIYNNEKYLENCISSILNQTLKDIQVILIDDGSTDSAPAICDRFAEAYSQVTVVHKKNEGSAAGRNDGIELAQGKYIAFVESDDAVDVNMYQEMCDYADKMDADIVKCGYYSCEQDKKVEVTMFYSIAEENVVFRPMDRPQIFLHHASMWASVYRRDFIIDNNIRCIVTPGATYSDFSWMVMTYVYAQRVAILHKPLYLYTNDNVNSSHVVQGKKCFYKPFHCAEANKICEKAGVMPQVREALGFQEYWTCLEQARYIDKSLRREYFFKVKEALEGIIDPGFKYVYFNRLDRMCVRAIMKGNVRTFYSMIWGERAVINGLNSTGLGRKMLWMIKTNKRNKQNAKNET